MSLKRLWYGISILLLVLTGVGSAGPARGQSAVYQYANGVTLAAASELPIFKIAGLNVTSDGTQALSRVLEGVFDPNNMQVREDAYNGHPRFTGVNEKNHTILEQFGATGGFYAYEPTRAFGDGSVVPSPELDPARAQLLACQFLMVNGSVLDPTSDNLQIPGLTQQCAHDFAKDPLYRVSTETRSGQSTTPGA